MTKKVSQVGSRLSWSSVHFLMFGDKWYGLDEVVIRCNYATHLTTSHHHTSVTPNASENAFPRTHWKILRGQIPIFFVKWKNGQKIKELHLGF